MATIRKRGKTYSVIYYFTDAEGVTKQKWESGLTLQEAKKLKNEVELAQINKNFIAPSQKTVAEFLDEWVQLYGKANWQYGTYTTNVGLIHNHVLPYIGEIPLQKLTPLDIEKLYATLREKKVSGAKGHRNVEDVPCLSSTTIRLIHVTLKRAFASAVEWKQLSTNPVACKAPKKNEVDTVIWDGATVAKALMDIKHEQLHLAVHLAFICSLRIGEAMGLTWDCVDFEKATVLINKTCQRVNKKALEELPSDSLIKVFPSIDEEKNSVIVLKKPKTKSSVRIIHITKPLLHELMMRKQLVAKQKCFHGKNYQDGNLVFCSETGQPIEPKLCEKWFKKWLSKTEGEFPQIIFHEIRHSSTTYKLVISEGDYKSVQADNGHSSADQTMNRYSHVQEQARLRMMKKIEQDFYPMLGEIVEDLPEEAPEDKVNALLAELQKDPSMRQMLLDALHAR